LLHSPDASDDTRDCVAILQAPQPSSGPFDGLPA
jgi:hypothetical protein